MISIIVLAVIAVFFLVFMRGYNYISYTLFFIAFLIAARLYFPAVLRRVIFAVAAVGLIYFCICEAPVVSSRRGDGDLPKDYLVVLGAAVRGTEPTLSLEHRLQKADDYLSKNPLSKVIVSGGRGDGEDISEAECMKRYLVSHGIDPDRIIKEEKSTSTMENLSFSKKIIEDEGGDISSVAILSSPYHLYRAKYMARSLGYIDPAGVACVYGYPVYTLGMFIREAFGVTHMWIFGD